MSSLNYFAPEQLSPRQALTPEGFLLCSDVPVARTGDLLYAAGEIPVEPNKNGIISVTRDASEVFKPAAVMSFAGKPVTFNHPPEIVAPDNYKKYSVGVVLNPRRGSGTLSSDYLYADLLIQDQAAIAAVRSKEISEISGGYNADYVTIAPGRGRQLNIVGNHVALVEKGRCGPSCAIGDSGAQVSHLISDKGKKAMPAAVRRPAWQDRIIQAMRTRDEEKLVDELEKVGEMLGNVLSGVDEAPPGVPAAADPHHIVVNVHGSAAPAAAPAVTPPAATPDVSDVPGATPPVPGAPPAPAAGGADLASLFSRVDRLEQAIAILVQAEGGEGAGGAGAEPDANGNNDPAGTGSGDKPDKEKPKSFDRRAATGDALTVDSFGFRAEFTSTVARAEFLVPGVQLADVRRQGIGNTYD